MIVTFYSFKGGVGRSMALANVAEILADRGYGVTACDFDIEAPGLELYLKADAEGRRELEGRPGIMDLLLEYKQSLTRPETRHNEDDGSFKKVGSVWIHKPSTVAIPIRSERPRRGGLRLLSAGRRDAEHRIAYADAVQRFDWAEFYDKWAGGAYLEFFREDLCEASDIVLVDSRTGVTEHGGVCTHHLADLVVLLTAANDLNLEGVEWMAKTLTAPELLEMRKQRRIRVLPVAARIEQTSEKDEKARFRDRMFRKLGRFVPGELGDPKRILEDTEIPYMPFYSFEERVAAREPEDTRDRDLFAAYDKLADAIVNYGVQNELLEPRDSDRWHEHEAGPELQQALELHREWIESGGDRGRRADFTRTDLGRVDLTNVRLDWAVMDGAKLRGARMSEAGLVEASLREADLSFANLRSARLEHAQMSEARMVGTNLQECLLKGACLDGADLESADLRRADLSGAKLAKARLAGARVDGARFDMASLRSADLTNISGIEEASLAGVDLEDASGHDDAGTKGARPIAARLRVVRNMFAVVGLASFGVIVVAVLGSSAVHHDAADLVGYINLWEFFGDPWLLRSRWIVILTALGLGLAHGAATYELLRSWRRVGTLPKRYPDGKTGAAVVAPWLPLRLLGLRWIRSRWEWFHEIRGLVVWWLAPFALIVGWTRYLVTHDTIGLVLLAALAWASAVLSIYAVALIRIHAHTNPWPSVVRFATLPAVALAFLTVLTVAVKLGTSWTANLDAAGLRTFAYLVDEDYTQGDTQGDLSGFDLRYARLSRSNLSGAKLVATRLSGASLGSTIATEADLTEADLGFANLADSTLVRTLFRRARLEGANIEGANLREADLTGADLRNARLKGADLTAALLTDTDLRGTDLSGVQGLTKSQSAAATTDAKTALPEFGDDPSATDSTRTEAAPGR